MDNSIGYLVWATLIVGSATVLLLAMPDLVLWFSGLKERLRGDARDALEHQGMTPTVTLSADVTAEKRSHRHA